MSRAKPLVFHSGRTVARKANSARSEAITVSQGRFRDNNPARSRRVAFTPGVLPAYLRKTQAIEELIPWLYLKGISTNDFAEALPSLVG